MVPHASLLFTKLPALTDLPAVPPLPDTHNNLQLAKAKEEASELRGEASRARAGSEFERDRCDRLASSLEMQRQQVESLMASSAAVQSVVTETERKMAEARSAADEAVDKVRGGDGGGAGQQSVRGGVRGLRWGDGEARESSSSSSSCSIHPWRS